MLAQESVVNKSRKLMPTPFYGEIYLILVRLRLILECVCDYLPSTSLDQIDYEMDIYVSV